MNHRRVPGLVSRFLLEAAKGAVVIAACFAGIASAHPILADASRELRVFPSPYARYLVGRYAMAQGDVDTASTALQAAAAGDPLEAGLREKAFLVAMMNGDIDQARAMTANYTPQSDATELMAKTVTAVTAVRARRYGEALKAVASAQAVDPSDRTAALLKPYILAMSGQWKKAVDDSGEAVFAAEGGDQLLALLLKAERARIEELKGHMPQAGALYEAVYKPGAPTFIFGPDYAGFLERQGRLDEARTVWQTIADSGHDANASRSLASIGSAGYAPPPLPDLTQSLARALFVSSTLYYGNRSTEMALVNLRLAIYLDPASDRQRLFLGQIQQDLKAPEAAEAAWAAIAPSSPYFAEAALRRIASLRGRDRNGDALQLVDQALAADPENLGYTLEKASLLQAQDDNKGALAVITDRVARTGEADLTWQAWYLKAMVYDSLDQWADAESAISKARALEPDRPEILNFLGYGWISRGVRVQEGIELIRKAMAINPRSGAIIDSLGWGYYKLGDYANALTYIEQAVQMQPSDPEINEHLGDVYKALGRDVEAGYEWQRVLLLDATPAALERVRKKLEDNTTTLRAKGLLPTPSAAPAKAAAQITSKTTADSAPVVTKKRGSFRRA